MSDFDYIVAGAGSAGCVLAARLSEDPSTRVLLLEAGGSDRSPLVSMPKGFGKLLADPERAWHFPTEPIGSPGHPETWVRGKMLGGSSSINGLIYNRGQQADWGGLEALGNKGWGWDTILPVYRGFEDHQLGAGPSRGVGGPLGISRTPSTDPLNEAMIVAGTAAGLEAVDDANDHDGERIGPTMATMRGGKRVSAAKAFLHPARRRPNLTIATGALVTDVVFDGDRAVGVRTRDGDSVVEHRAAREVILCLGSIQTPAVLQRSGIGPTEVLRAAGIDVRVDAAHVGGRMREHRCFVLQHRLRERGGYNPQLATRTGQALAAARYLFAKRGPLASPSFDVVGYLRTDPTAERVDAQILMAPFSLADYEVGENPEVEQAPGVQCIGYVLRPTSEGHVHVTGAAPDAPLRIEANYLATDHDREVGTALFARMREIFAQEPIAGHVSAETLPGSGVTDPEALVNHALERGFCGYHAIGTAAMGPDDTDAVDPQLRVRGVEGLRVMDCSVLPAMVSGNLNGPMMAMGWHAADVVRDGPLS